MFLTPLLLKLCEIIAGNVSAKVSGGEWLKYKKDDSFDIAANTSFEVMCETDVAYICYYN